MTDTAKRKTTRRFGDLVLTRDPDGCWNTPDGRFVIQHDVQGVTTCDAAHPMGKGGGYCTGGEEHEYFGWAAWDKQADAGNGDYVDGIRCADSFKEAATDLAAHVSRTV